MHNRSSESARVALQITIPDDVAFADLQLARDAACLTFAWEPLERICAASGIDPAVLTDGPKDNAAGLIVRWYVAHRAIGGAPDPVVEDLLDEMRLEDERGGGLSHEPGQA